MVKLARTSRVALLSIASNTLLIILKIVVGILSRSVSIISEAIHSSMDLFAAVIAFFSTRESAKPADREHPFGHGKIEAISGLIEGALIFVAAGLIINEAIQKILDPHPIEFAFAAVAVMLVSAIANLFVSSRLYKVAKEEDSLALEADALHLRTDVLTSLGVAVGVGLSYALGLAILDPIVAILVATLIIWEAWKLCRRGFSCLLDAKLSDEEESRAREIIERHSESFRGYHKLKTTKSGNRRSIDFHVVLDPDTSVLEAHALIGEIKRDFSEEFKASRVTVHIDPYDALCNGDSAS